VDGAFNSGSDNQRAGRCSALSRPAYQTEQQRASCRLARPKHERQAASVSAANLTRFHAHGMASKSYAVPSGASQMVVRPRPPLPLWHTSPSSTVPSTQHQHHPSGRSGGSATHHDRPPARPPRSIHLFLLDCRPPDSAAAQLCLLRRDGALTKQLRRPLPATA